MTTPTTLRFVSSSKRRINGILYPHIDLYGDIISFTTWHLQLFFSSLPSGVQKGDHSETETDMASSNTSFFFFFHLGVIGYWLALLSFLTIGKL